MKFPCKVELKLCKLDNNFQIFLFSGLNKVVESKLEKTVLKMQNNPKRHV